MPPYFIAFAYKLPLARASQLPIEAAIARIARTD